MLAEPFQSATWTISVLRKDAKTEAPAVRFLMDLGNSDQIKFLNLFEYTIYHGPSKNPEKFKIVEGEIWEFKSKPYRILCFFATEKHIVLTHGFKKQKQKLERRQIARAEEMRRLYLNQLGGQKQ